MLFVDPVKLREAKKSLAEDIQNITDSLIGFDKHIYNDKWFENFLFGGTDRYSGIFSKASYQDKGKPGIKGNWVPERAVDYQVLDKIEKKYGTTAKNNILEMSKVKLKRKILGD